MTQGIGCRVHAAVQAWGFAVRAFQNDRHPPHLLLRVDGHVLRGNVQLEGRLPLHVLFSEHFSHVRSLLSSHALFCG